MVVFFFRLTTRLESAEESRLLRQPRPVPLPDQPEAFQGQVRFHELNDFRFGRDQVRQSPRGDHGRLRAQFLLEAPDQPVQFSRPARPGRDWEGFSISLSTRR